MHALWTPGRTLYEVEKDVIFAALRFYQNNKVRTAQALGICYKTLNNKLEQYNGTIKLSNPDEPTTNPDEPTNQVDVKEVVKNVSPKKNNKN